MKYIFILFIFSSCINLNKKSDSTCVACYNYLLSNCPNLASTDTVQRVAEFTIVGSTMLDTLFLPAICDSLKKLSPTNPTLIFKDKKNGTLRQKIRLIDNAKLITECTAETIIIKDTAAVPCNCIFTNKDFANYTRAQTTHIYYKWRWHVLAVLVFISVLYISFKK